MASYDEVSRRIVLRIVYDGPGFAGKTTNLRALAGFFTLRRRGELVTPEELEGRTQYFDWMDLDGGLVQGHPLRCRLLTVPGQRRLAGRRAALLRQADAVVWVCDSTRQGVLDAMRMLDILSARMESIRDDPPPLIVQANKQDHPAALTPEAVREGLGLGDGFAVLGARAHIGVGVRETLVLAIRAAADRLQDRLLADGVDAIERDDETPEALVERLRHEEMPHLTLALLPEPSGEDPGPAAPMSVPASMLDAALPIAGTEGIAAEHVSAIPAPQLVAPAPPSALDAPSATLPIAAPVAQAAIPFTTAALAHDTSESHTDEPAPEERAQLAGPPWPDPEAPTGSIWPAATGRELLRRLRAMGTPERRDHLRGRTATADGSGKTDLLLFGVEGVCLKTSPRRRFADLDTARGALLTLARRKRSLGALLPADTVLCVAATGDEAWVWTVTPWMTTLGTRMERAQAAGDGDSLGAALVDFAEAAVTSMLLTARRSVVLDVHPSNFARTDEGIVYLDDDIDEGREAPALGYSLIKRVEEYGAFPSAVGRYVEALERALRERLRADDVVALGVQSALATVPGATPRMREAAARLTRALDEIG